MGAGAPRRGMGRGRPRAAAHPHHCPTPRVSGWDKLEPSSQRLLPSRQRPRATWRLTPPSQEGRCPRCSDVGRNVEGHTGPGAPLSGRRGCREAHSEAQPLWPTPTVPTSPAPAASPQPPLGTHPLAHTPLRLCWVRAPCVTPWPSVQGLLHPPRSEGLCRPCFPRFLSGIFLLLDPCVPPAPHVVTTPCPPPACVCPPLLPPSSPTPTGGRPPRPHPKLSASCSPLQSLAPPVGRAGSGAQEDREGTGRHPVRQAGRWEDSGS